MNALNNHTVISDPQKGSAVSGIDTLCAASNDNDSGDRLLRLREVMQMVGLGKTMIYRLINDGSFPPPYKPGGHASRWCEAEVRAWRQAVGAARNAG